MISMTHTVSIVLNIAAEKADEFERAFEEHEVPTWNELIATGKLLRASLSPLDISTKDIQGVRQYLIIAQFAHAEDHHAHDNDPRFKRWNTMADQYQPEEPFVFGGDSLYEVGG
jgi:quinol monooxygenase YgiN